MYIYRYRKISIYTYIFAHEVIVFLDAMQETAGELATIATIGKILLQQFCKLMEFKVNFSGIWLNLLTRNI